MDDIVPLKTIAQKKVTRRKADRVCHANRTDEQKEKRRKCDRDRIDRSDEQKEKKRKCDRDCNINRTDE